MARKSNSTLISKKTYPYNIIPSPFIIYWIPLLPGREIKITFSILKKRGELWVGSTVKIFHIEKEWDD